MENKKVNKPSLQKAIQGAAEKAIEGFMQTVDQKINSLIENSMLYWLGVTNEWGKAEMDHCNGRFPIISEVLKDRAKKQLERMINKLDFSDLPNAEAIRQAFRKEYESALSSQARYYGESKAKEMVSAVVGQIVDSELKKWGIEKIKKEAE